MKWMTCKKILPILLCTVLFYEANTQSSQGWQNLFNGKDFAGWRELNGKHKWEIKNGVIVGTDVPGQPNGFLCTDKEYEDFILELEVSIDTLMNNSGVQFRSISTAEYQNGRVHGYQMEIDPKPQKWSGSIYEEGGTRHWLYTNELNTEGKKAFKNNQWNKYRIECFGNNIRTWVNGIPISHLIDEKFEKGFIGLQLHTNNPNDPPGGNQVRFRNIRIKTGDISPSPPDDIFVVNTVANNLSPQEKRIGYVLLWDGKTTNGWINAKNSANTITSWNVNNDALCFIDSKTQTASRSHDIMTTKQFALFILKFDFRIAKGTNSGVKYFVDIREGKKKAIATLEYQIVDDSIAGISGNNVLGSMTGILAPLVPTNKIFYQRKIGDWNQAILKVFRNHVEYWLNGFKILDFEGVSPEYRELIAKTKIGSLMPFGTNSKGNIILEGSTGEVCFRSLKIYELK